MKPCHGNNGAAIYVGRAVQNPCLNVQTTVESLTGTLLLVSCSNTFQNLLWSVHGQGQKR